MRTLSSMSKRTASAGFGSLGTGAVTALALAVQTGLAAVVGVIVARDFGRTAQTDGFFAAYGVFIVVVLAATAIRIAVLPPLARARGERRLGAEVAAYALTLGALALPLLALGLFVAHPLSWLLTGNGPDAARRTATGALPWMMLAAVFQLYAGLAASSLAALDHYVVTAVGFATGSIAGLVLILARVRTDGLQVVSWGMALNSLVTFLMLAAALGMRARSQRMPVEALRPTGLSFGARMAEMGRGVAQPLAMQAIYLIGLPLAGREGTGAVTSFGYAYLIASAIVVVTASSLGLVTAVPLSRRTVDPEGIARHVAASSWLALIVVGAASGLFGLAGGRIVHALLGGDYGSEVGRQLGRVVIALAPWAVVAVTGAVVFPLVFVAGRARLLPAIAAGALLLHVPLAVIGQVLGGLNGLAIALAVTSTATVVAMLLLLGALGATVRRLGTAAGIVAAIAVPSFAIPSLFASPTLAAGIGLGVYVTSVAALRPRGMTAAWRYLRALG